MKNGILILILLISAACLGLLVEMRLQMQKVITVEGPKNHYFATTEDGRLIPMTPLNERNLSKAALISWVGEAVIETMTFGYHDYRKRLESSSRNFTKEGWESFLKTLNEYDILDSVKNSRQIMSAVPSGTPVLLSEGENKTGRYHWLVELPVTITYKAGSRQKSEKTDLRLMVVRTPRLENKSGVAIEQWQMSKPK